MNKVKEEITGQEFDQIYALANSKGKNVKISTNLLMRFVLTRGRWVKALNEAGINTGL